MSDFERVLRAELGDVSALSPEMVGALERHYRLLCDWNRRINLSAVTELRDAIRLHYCESLALAHYLPSGPLRVADLGSGAGFPGVPVAISRQDLNLTLIESDRRKAVFLAEACFGLPNVRVLTERFEKVPAAFDWVVSRAVRFEDVVARAAEWRASVAFLGAGAEIPVAKGAERYSWRVLPLAWRSGHFLWLGGYTSLSG